MTTGIAALLGIALLDAMNPFSIAAMAFLLATDRPVARGWAFVLGTAAIYLPFGVALLEGWAAFLRDLLPRLPPWMAGGLEAVTGVACLWAALRLWRRSDANAAAVPHVSSLSVGATLAFAGASTLADLPTAVPYFAAASQIPALADGRLSRYAWLAIYNLVYVAPLLAMLGARLALGARADRVLGAVRRGVEWSFAHLMPPLLAFLGLVLLADGVRRLTP